ncbi:protein of unknown function [Pseudomonas sp. JV241A]|nr:protein of unknown function [Pseudomonas sp. JV241A]
MPAIEREAVAIQATDDVLVARASSRGKPAPTHQS